MAAVGGCKYHHDQIVREQLDLNQKGELAYGQERQRQKQLTPPEHMHLWGSGRHKFQIPGMVNTDKLPLHMNGLEEQLFQRQNNQTVTRWTGRRMDGSKQVDYTHYYGYENYNGEQPGVSV